MIIYNIGEFITATEEFFIEAFFRQGKDTWNLKMKQDCGMSEYKRCSHKEFIHHNQLS